MIADLKADSARWEADVARTRYERNSHGHYAGSGYVPKHSLHHAPSIPPVTGYPVDVRPASHPSPPTFGAAPPQPAYAEPYAPSSYAAPPAVPPYPSYSPYGSAQTPYVASTYPHTVQPPPVAVAPDPVYTYTPSPTYGFENNERYTAPRYTGSTYESEPEYPVVTSSISYSGSPSADPRIGVDPRYSTPEPTYPDRNSRPPQPRDRDGRRPR